MPAFTYRTMVTPEVGPANNGIAYGGDHYYNREALPFHPDMPADPLMGILPETLRNHPDSRRSSHPILSFTGLNADAILGTQTLYDPFAPIAALEGRVDVDSPAHLSGRLVFRTVHVERYPRSDEAQPDQALCQIQRLTCASNTARALAPLPWTRTARIQAVIGHPITRLVFDAP